MIEIIHAEKAEDYWTCWLQITRDEDSWMLPATAPGTRGEEELQIYFDAQEDELWKVAQEKQYAPDVLRYIPERRLLKAVALVLLDEINFVRTNPGFHENLTVDEMIAKVKAKIRR